MAISRDQVQHVARLARIKLAESEEEKFEKELSSILDFVEKLNEVDTAGVLPLTGGTMLQNVMRQDPAGQSDLEGKAAELLDAVADRKGMWVKVRAIFQ